MSIRKIFRISSLRWRNHIECGRNELGHVKTFGELCEVITSKITLPDTGGCTSQQAFYKIRNALSVVTSVEKGSIELDDALSDYFPRNGVRAGIERFNKELESDPDILAMRGAALSCLTGMTFISL